MAFCCMAAPAAAQRFSLSAGAGWMPSTFFRTMQSIGGVDFSTAYPTYNINFTWKINPNLLATASAIYEYSAADGRTDMPPFNYYHESRYTYGGLMGLTFNWGNRTWFTWYSSVECGMMGYSASSESPGLRGVTQICPIGLCVGKKAGGFMEIGYGIKGLFNAGAFLRW